MRVHTCERCDIEYTNVRCPRCGDAPTTTVVSEVPDTVVVDMVEKASRPSLADLVKQGVQRGLIRLEEDYAQRRAKS